MVGKNVGAFDGGGDQIEEGALFLFVAIDRHLVDLVVLERLLVDFRHGKNVVEVLGPKTFN